MRVFGKPIEVKQAIDWAKLRNNQHLTYAVQTHPGDTEWFGWCIFMGKGETVHEKLSMRRKQFPEFHDGIQRFAFQDMVKWAQDAGLYPIDGGGTGVATEQQDDDSGASMAEHKASKEDYREEVEPVVELQSPTEAPRSLQETFKPKGKVVEPSSSDNALKELLEAAARDAYWSGYRTGQLAERYQRGRA
jgi:hypothetical protein